MTGKLSVIVDAMYNFLHDNAETFNLLPEDVYFGDQNLFPRFPSIEVLGGESRRELVTRPYGTDVTFDVFIQVVYGEIRTTEWNVMRAQQYAEGIEDFIHTNLLLDGLVLWGMVQRIEMGEVPKSQRMMRASRLTWQGFSRDNLPAPT